MERKIGRPALAVSVRKHGFGFKVFEMGRYAGYISGRKLLQAVRNKRPSPINAQVSGEEAEAGIASISPALPDGRDGGVR